MFINPLHRVKEGLMGPVFIPFDIKMVRERFLPGARSKVLVHEFILPDQYKTEKGTEMYRKLGGVSKSLFVWKDKKLSTGLSLKIAFAGLKGLTKIGESKPGELASESGQNLPKTTTRTTCITSIRHITRGESVNVGRIS